MRKEISLYDSNGYEWVWDGRRVYMVLAEIEMEETNDADQNGYPASTLKEAKSWLE